MLKVSEIPFFSKLSSNEILEVTQLLEKRRVPAHSLVCRKGQRGQLFYAVASGGVKVSLAAGTETRERSVFLGPGHIFGEMSLLADNPVSATVETVNETHPG
jgi:voltage-gated potassium channel